MKKKITWLTMTSIGIIHVTAGNTFPSAIRIRSDGCDQPNGSNGTDTSPLPVLNAGVQTHGPDSRSTAAVSANDVVPVMQCTKYTLVCTILFSFI
jgi:hypothetical protein